ncbi:hypothetical protein WJX73_008735 [Symbiochloris irregularis]|uniref:BZIP domain-containing protein n=1 Tax=Symbiochloris irregularis TaxID=706552 RepID=A0AAW1PJA8_9CHLO
MDQSLVDQAHAYHVQLADGMTDPATAAAMAAAAAVPPDGSMPGADGQAGGLGRAGRSSSGISREGGPEEDEERRAKRRLANREAARRMRSRRQQQSQTLQEEVAQLRAANQQLMERLSITSQQHQDAMQQITLLRNENLTLKQSMMDGSVSMSMAGTSNGLPPNLMAVPAHLYSPGVIKQPAAEDGGDQLPEEHTELQQHPEHDDAHGAVEGAPLASDEAQQQMGHPMDASGMGGHHHVADTGQMDWATGLQSSSLPAQEG